MPTLNWIGKQAVEKHHLEIPYRLLEYDDSLSVGDKDSGNLIIQGDNLHALKALLPYYAGKVKCIYIDPPYNTGKEKWKFNDNVNSPEIKKWLDDFVGKEGEDLSRHDKWLCMMYPRLKLLHKLLHKNGIIIIHIDENSYSYLHLLMIEIFGRNNELGTLIWDKKNPKGDATKLSYQHESIILFSKNYLNVKEDLVRKKKNAVAMLRKAELLFSKLGKQVTPEDLTVVVKKYNLSKSILEENLITVDLEFINREFNNWIKKQDFSGGESAYNNIDEEGNVYQSVSMAWPNKQKAPDDYFIPLIHPITKKPCPVPGRGWRFPPKTMSELLTNKEILFGIDEGTQPRRKYILINNLNENISSIIRFGGSDDKFQSSIGIKLENPKPFIFANEILGYFTKNNDIILDSFAGSGTTAHSVLKLNQEDHGHRKFILVELEEDIAKKITSERVKRVIEGYTISKQDETSEQIEGLGSGYRYCKLSETLFDKYGNIRDGVKFRELAFHVFFSENGMPLKENTKFKSPFIGKYKGTAYYLLFNGILGDKSINGGNVLTTKILSQLPEHKGQKIIFGESCRLSSARLKQENIIFKQIPYEIKTS